MNRKIPHLPLRAVAIALLILSTTGVIDYQTAYADPSLPIVADQGGFSIEIYPQQHRLIVRAQGQKMKTYTVAVGNPSTPTPIGEYKVVYKGKSWGPSFGPRWLGLNVLFAGASISTSWGCTASLPSDTPSFTLVVRC